MFTSVGYVETGKDILAGKNDDDLVKQSDELTNYYIGLRAHFLVMKECNTLPPQIAQEIERVLSRPNKTWKNAYEIEQYLAYYYEGSMLDIELQIKLVEYKERIANREDVMDIGEMDVPSKRIYLLRIIKKLQWYYTNRETQREYTYLIRQRTVIVFFCSFLAFCFSLLFAVVCVDSNLPLIKSMFGPFSNTLSHISTSVLIIGMCAGLLGASFSMITSMKRHMKCYTIEDLRLKHRFDYLLCRPLIGVGGALILFFLMQSGLLPPIDIFPDLQVIRHYNTENTAIYKIYDQISLIIVWSFIAGFSEQFIPHILEKTEARVDEQKQDHLKR